MLIAAESKIYTVAVTSTILFGFCFCFLHGLSRNKEASTCQTGTIEMVVTSEEIITEHTGSTYRVVCSEKIQATKCEGSCESNVTPSVTHFDGRKKVCSCCREGDTVVRDVRLSHCYHGDTVIAGSAITRTVTEPINCVCQNCTVN